MRTSTVVTITVGTLVTGALGYAAYFDYRRRNDPQFRNKLRKDAKRSERAAKRESQQREREEAAFIEQTVADMSKPGALPTSVQEKEEVFMQSVQVGETLVAQGPQHYKTAAAAFYRGLKVYPNPAELLIIYRQAVPEQALDYVRQMVAKDSALSGATSQDPLAAALAQAAAGAPKAGGSLEEIDDEGPRAPGPAGASATSTPPAESSNNQAPSVSSQEWEKVSKHQDEGPPVGSYAAAAAAPVTMPHERNDGLTPGASGPTPVSSGPGVTSHSHHAQATVSSAPEGSYAAAAEQHVDIPQGQGAGEAPVPQPTTEHM